MRVQHPAQHEHTVPWKLLSMKILYLSYNLLIYNAKYDGWKKSVPQENSITKTAAFLQDSQQVPA